MAMAAIGEADQAGRRREAQHDPPDRGVGPLARQDLLQQDECDRRHGQRAAVPGELGALEILVDRVAGGIVGADWSPARRGEGPHEHGHHRHQRHAAGHDDGKVRAGQRPSGSHGDLVAGPTAGTRRWPGRCPSTMSGRPTRRRPPVRRKAGSSWVTTRPAVTRANDVRIHARNVRSLA